jgi:hypothetical protein
MLSRLKSGRRQAKFAGSSIVFEVTGSVVATDCVSADADHDNGGPFYCRP